MATLTQTIEQPMLDEISFPVRTVKPVKWWAAIGGIYLALALFSTTRWLLSGNFGTPGVGASDLPTYMLVSIRAHEVVLGLLGAGTVYYKVIRPWRRDGRLSWDGIMVLSMITLWWQDPLSNYTQPYFAYNAGVVNVGCPQCFMPGWQSNMTKFAEPIFFGLFWYFGFLFVSTVAGNYLMKRAQRRWPRIGKLGLVLYIFGVAVIFDLVTEALWLRTGMYTYAGSHKGVWTLFHGEFYAVPMYEIVVASMFYVPFLIIRYFRNDKGESIAERGIDEVRVSGKQRTALRLLAMVGAVNAGFFLSYNVPMYFMATHTGSWPKDVTTRTYFTQKHCGLGTDFACPDDRVPIPHGPQTARATPEGKLIAPEGLPVQIP